MKVFGKPFTGLGSRIKNVINTEIRSAVAQWQSA